jgi:hypothetical protein
VLSFIQGKIFVISRANQFVPSKAPLVNLSTRALVQAGDGVMIGGFIIDGTVPKTVLIRGRGPSLSTAPFSVPGVLADPFLRLFSGQNVIAENNNWRDAPNCGFLNCGTAAQIIATGMDPCQPNPGQGSAPAGCEFESALLITLNPGAYTVHLDSLNGTAGIGLIEVFEADNNDLSQLVNLSTRARSQTGDGVMIGGFVIDGAQPKTILIRGRGPSMSGAPFLFPVYWPIPFCAFSPGRASLRKTTIGKMPRAATGSVAALPPRLQPSVWIRVERIQDNRRHQQVANLNRLF